MNDDGAGFSVGRAADVGPGVRLLAAPDDQHADQDSRLDLLRDDDAAVGIRSHLVAVLVPVHVVRRIRASRCVARQLDRAGRFHVFRSLHLDCCNTDVYAFHR